MKLSQKCYYAIKCLLDFYSNENTQNLIQIKETVLKQNIPMKFLQNILLDLKKAGYIDSKRGPNGGYFLKKKPKEISLKEIIQLIDGPIDWSAIKETDNHKIESKNATKVITHFLNEANKQLKDFLENKTFEELYQSFKLMSLKSKDNIYYI